MIQGHCVVTKSSPDHLVPIKTQSVIEADDAHVKWRIYTLLGLVYTSFACVLTKHRLTNTSIQIHVLLSVSTNLEIRPAMYILQVDCLYNIGEAADINQGLCQ